MLELAALLWILGQCAAGLGFLVGIVLLIVWGLRSRRERRPHIPRPPTPDPRPLRPKRSRARRLG